MGGVLLRSDTHMGGGGTFEVWYTIWGGVLLRSGTHMGGYF